MCTQVLKGDRSSVVWNAHSQPASSCEVLVEVMLSIAAARVVQVEVHSFHGVKVEMEGWSRAVLHVIADVHNKNCLLL
jgi:hypothetical protein